LQRSKFCATKIGGSTQHEFTVIPAIYIFVGKTDNIHKRFRFNPRWLCWSRRFDIWFIANKYQRLLGAVERKRYFVFFKM